MFTTQDTVFTTRDSVKYLFTTPDSIYCFYYSRTVFLPDKLNLFLSFFSFRGKHKISRFFFLTTCYYLSHALSIYLCFSYFVRYCYFDFICVFFKSHYLCKYRSDLNDFTTILKHFSWRIY